MQLKYFNLPFLVILTYFLGYILNILLRGDELLLNTLAGQLSANQIEEYLNFQKKWQWVSFVIIPIIFLIKISFIASFLYLGTFFFSKVKVTFKQLFQVVVRAEFVFLLVSVAKIIWFYFFQTNYTLEDLQYFYPLSALNIVGYQGLEPWFIYPLQVLNLFELVYWLVLAYFIGKLAFTEKDKGKPMDLGLKIVASSYGSALLLWVVVVMFFTLNYS